MSQASENGDLSEVPYLVLHKLVQNYTIAHGMTYRRPMGIRVESLWA
jgi:hypothetical protein